MKTFKKALTASAVAVALAAPMAANATNGILPLGNGMAAHGLGGAGIANAGDVMAGVDNPALVSRSSNQKGLGVSVFSPSRSATLNFGPAGVHTMESDNDYFLIPQGGYTANMDAKKDWGILVYAMGGMNTEYPMPAIIGGGRVGIDLMGLVVAPTMSFKVNDKTSVGASLLLGYEALDFTNEAPAFSGMMPPSQSDSATGWGVKLGVVSEVAPGTSVGLTYQSEISMGEMDAFCNASTGGMFSGVSDCALNMPSQMGIGISHQVNGKIKVVADVLKVSWSDVPVFDEMFMWEDQTIVKAGIEYKANENTVYRFGINHGGTPIPDEAMVLNWLAPAITEDHYTFGIGKNMGKGATINGYIAYVPEAEQTAPASLGGASAKMDQFALGVGWNWKY